MDEDRWFGMETQRRKPRKQSLFTCCYEERDYGHISLSSGAVQTSVAREVRTFHICLRLRGVHLFVRERDEVREIASVQFLFYDGHTSVTNMPVRGRSPFSIR